MREYSWPVLILMFVAVIACNIFALRVLYEATWLPMSDNYHQCGRIFRCPAQH